MAQQKPPFRADHVGSFLRSATLKTARLQRENGEITLAQLKEVENHEIEKVIAKQEEIGLKLATERVPSLVVALRFLWHATVSRSMKSITESSSKVFRPSRARSASSAQSASQTIR
jgi:methionine synthase II (cobalamin-independent)